MKHSKRFLAFALALMLLLSLGGAALAAGEEAPGEEIVLTIYEQTGEDGEETVLASYTESEYAALLTDGSLTYSSLLMPHKLTITSYVALSELLGEAFGSGDTLRYVCLEKDGSVQEYKKDCARSYEDLIAAERYFYAAADAEGLAVPAVLSASRRLFVGETDGYRTQSGSFWPGSICSITIVHPAAETSPEAQEPVQPTETLLDPIAAEDIYETEDSVVLSMDVLRATEEVSPEDITRTLGYIEKTRKGEMKQREPFSVVERGDGTYSILDGNKSFYALKELGAESVPVIVADRPYHKDVEGFDELIALYTEAEAEFHQLAASLGEEIKAELSEYSDLTDADAIHQRAKENHDGDYGKVVDVLSADLSVPAEELEAAARKLLENDSVLCVYRHEEDKGYTAYIRLSNGAIAELRLMAGAAGKRVYFAAPLFSQAELEYNLKLVKVLEDCGYEVFLPQRDGYLAAELEGKTEEELTQMIFDKDVGEVLKADIVFMLLDGRVPDEGACVELGIAYASGKRCYGFKTDSRSVEKNLDLNPMIGGCFIKVFSDIDGERLIAALEQYLAENEL